jgi:hypothetical protein
MKHKAYIDWQSVARSFQEGDRVRGRNPVDGRFTPWEGEVTAVMPGIGMVDVQTPYGNVRFPAEELTITSRDPDLEDTSYETEEQDEEDKPVKSLATRVAAQIMRREALYWAAPGRQYLPTKKEVELGVFTCPKCDTELKKTIYKKRTKLYICTNVDCLFCIKPSDILDRNRPDDVEVEEVPFDAPDSVDFFGPNDAILKSVIEGRMSRNNK